MRAEQMCTKADRRIERLTGWQSPRHISGGKHEGGQHCVTYARVDSLPSIPSKCQSPFML